MQAKNIHLEHSPKDGSKGTNKLDLKMAELPPIIRNSERIPTFSSLHECVEYFSDIHFKRAFVIALDYTAH